MSVCIVSVNGIIRQCEYPEQSAETSMELDSSSMTENRELCPDSKILLAKSQLLPPLVFLSYSFLLYMSLWSSRYSNKCNKTALVSKSVWEENQTSVSKSRSRTLFVNTGKCQHWQAISGKWSQPDSDTSQRHIAIPQKKGTFRVWAMEEEISSHISEYSE